MFPLNEFPLVETLPVLRYSTEPSTSIDQTSPPEVISVLLLASFQKPSIDGAADGGESLPPPPHPATTTAETRDTHFNAELITPPNKGREAPARVI
jgi:hypothetical protein